MFETFNIPAILSLDSAGRDITKYFIQLLMERAYGCTASAEREIVRDIKERLCYIASDYENEKITSLKTNTIEWNYKSPDGRIITIIYRFNYSL